MVIVHFLSWTLLAAEVCVAFPVVYLCILSCSALIGTRQKKRAYTDKQASPQSNFALLIPAHDEEVILGTLLESLSHLDYPKELYTIYVIADNCTDTTAELACRVEGVCVYERFDREKRGKGYALNWMLQQIEDKQHDAYIVLGAHLSKGDRHLRAHYVPGAIVRAQMPITFAQMRTQDVRWEAVDPQESQWRTAWQLLRGGLRARSFVQIEAMMELLTPPLSTIVA